MRWGHLKLLGYALKHAFHIFHDLIVPELDNAVAVLHQFGAPLFVRFRVVRVLTAIHFNGELAPRARKVSNTPANRMLSTKPAGRKVFPEVPPEKSFGVRRIAAQAARDARSGA